MNMPLDYINSLYKLAETREKAEQQRREEKAKEEGKNNVSMTTNQAIALEDELEAMM